MRVYEIISLLRNENQRISIRRENHIYGITMANSDLIEDIKDREIIDIIPNIDFGDTEKDCFVINIK